LQSHEALAIVPQICDALQFAHDQGIVHRDIKPENLLVDKQGRVKIADFGLAKLMNAASADFRLTGTHQVMGTPLYMAPEQIERTASVDHRADIYSLGVVFYEMLTGELPLGRFAAPSKKVHIDVRLDDVVLRTLEKEPDLRYQKVSQVGTEVEAIARKPRLASGRRWLSRDGKPLVRPKVVWWTLAACVMLAPVTLVVLVFAMRMSEIVEAEEQRARAAMLAEQVARQGAKSDAQARLLDYVPPTENAMVGGTSPGSMGGMSGMGMSGGGGSAGMMPTAMGQMPSILGMGVSPNHNPVHGDFVGALTDGLNLTPAQRKLLDQALQDAQQEYRQLDEKRTTAHVGDAGELQIQIKCVDSRTQHRLEDRLWSRVDALLDDPDVAKRNHARTTARQYIRAEILFQFLSGADIRIHRTGTFYTWRYVSNGQANDGTGPKLPDFLQQFWTRYSKLLDADTTEEKKTEDPKPPPAGEKEEK
ncbi:MAG: serine/threonine protein kinase, partial [Planctomycetales bacterium]|nr:serine/threonine protein kinase [Planctomycetales bacterium]